MIKEFEKVNHWPRIGHIRLGMKVQSGETTRPKEIDYFVFDPNTGDVFRDAELTRQFREIYGERPKSIVVMFPKVPKMKTIEEEIDLFFPQYYKRYGMTKALKCIGDGVEAQVTNAEYAMGLETIGFDRATRRTKVRCLGIECIYQDAKKKPECKRSGNLFVILPELDAIGVFQVNTSSFSSVANINSMVRYLKDAAGKYHYIPIMMSRVAKQSTYTDQQTGKICSSTHYPIIMDCRSRLSAARSAPELPDAKALLGVTDQRREAIGKEQEAVVDASWTEAPLDEVKDTLTPAHLNEIKNAAGMHGWLKREVNAYCKEIYCVDTIEGLPDLYHAELLHYINTNPVKGGKNGKERTN